MCVIDYVTLCTDTLKLKMIFGIFYAYNACMLIKKTNKQTLTEIK